MKRKALALTLVVTIFVVTTLAVLLVVKPNPSSYDNPDQKALYIASFSPQLYGNIIIGGYVVLVNPTNRYFCNLNLTVEVDDLKLIVPRLLMTVEGNFSWRLPVTTIAIDPHQNETIDLLFGILDLGTFTSYFGDVQIEPFSSHVIKFYVSQNKFGDVINGQALTIPQKKAYLQILGYSSIEHSNNTWHEYYNSSTNRYEYVNDQPNFYQQYHYFFPLDLASYNWAKSLNQIGEHYFNVTIHNNSTFPVKGIVLFGGSPNGEGSMAFALSDMILQPNETYVLPVQASGKNWWSVENVYQLSNFFPAYAYASGDLVSSQE
jgi:hypothetical protein